MPCPRPPRLSLTAHPENDRCAGEFLDNTRPVLGARALAVEDVPDHPHGSTGLVSRSRIGQPREPFEKLEAALDRPSQSVGFDRDLGCRLGRGAER